MPDQIDLEFSGGSFLRLAAELNNAAIGTINSYPLDFKTNDSTKLRVDTSGNVGIGTTVPTTALEVNGIVRATSFQGNGATLDGIVNTTGDTMTGPLSVQAALTVSGNVGIGTTEPQGKLDVRGDIRAGNSDLYFTKTDHNHTAIGNTSGFAAIENAASHDALMILGRAGTPKGRTVKLWDYLQVNGDLDVTGNITGRVAGIGIAVTNALAHGSSIPIPTGFTKEECVFFAFVKAIFNVDVIPFNCFAQDGVVRITRQAVVFQGQPTPVTQNIFATGIAIAKKGGW